MVDRIKRITAHFLTLLILVLLSITLISCEPTVQQCFADSDCVPAQCCHPTEAVNKEEAPDCSATACTAVCEGPLDCGQGEIKCLSNRCTVVALS